MDPHACTRRQALGEQEILDAERNAVQRPTPLAGSDFLVGPARGGQSGLGHHHQEAVQPPVEALDAVEHGAGDLDRRDLPAADLGRNAEQALIVKIGHGRSSGTAGHPA